MGLRVVGPLVELCGGFFGGRRSPEEAAGKDGGIEGPSSDIPLGRKPVVKGIEYNAVGPFYYRIGRSLGVGRSPFLGPFSILPKE